MMCDVVTEVLTPMVHWENVKKLEAHVYSRP